MDNTSCFTEILLKTPSHVMLAWPDFPSFLSSRLTWECDFSTGLHEGKTKYIEIYKIIGEEVKPNKHRIIKKKAKLQAESHKNW